MPPYDFIPSSRRFTFNGRPVSRQEIRAEIDKLLAYVQKESARIAGKYSDGSISITEFELGMRELLKAAHIVSASVGRGGRARMSQSDWGKVGNKIKWQYEYLAKFARKLATGKLEKAYSAYRAKQYASALYISYSTARQETAKEIIDRNDGKTPDGDKVKVRLIQTSEEGCVECSSDADEGWMNPEDMGELGSRICGDFCKCFLEFSDEVEGEET